MTEEREEREDGGAQGHCGPDDDEAFLETNLVVGVSPDNSAQSVGESLEDRDSREEVVVVDEGETEGLAEV